MGGRCGFEGGEEKVGTHRTMKVTRGEREPREKVGVAKPKYYDSLSLVWERLQVNLVNSS